MVRIGPGWHHVPHPVAAQEGKEPATPRILIVDDHALFAEAVRGAIQGLGPFDVSVVQTGEEAIAEVERGVPDVILMDIGLPDQSGLLAGRTILAGHKDAKIVALTALTDRAVVDEALRLGFVGYLSKDTPVAQFMNAIQSAMDGHLVLPQRLSPIRRPTEADDHVALLAGQLTAREREVLGLLVQGIDGRKAASALGISPNTVRTHVQSILTKLQVHSRLEAAAFAVRHQLVPAPSTAKSNGMNGHRAADRPRRTMQPS